METRSIAVDTFGGRSIYAQGSSPRGSGPFGVTGPGPTSDEPGSSLLDGPPLGIYRISAYLNLGFVGICLLLLGVGFVFTHELGWLAAITAIASGGLLSAFAWRRATALEREGRADRARQPDA